MLIAIHMFMRFMQSKFLKTNLSKKKFKGGGGPLVSEYMQR